MAKPPLSHYAPKFANKAWADEKGVVSYFYCEHLNAVRKEKKGKKQWGRKRGLYSWVVENALANELENDASKIYTKLVTYEELEGEDRIIWSQFLLSQLIRTPTFMRYEQRMIDLYDIKVKPKEDRIGCKHCLDINFVANRDWCLLLAHEDDYFVRSDNPILQTGFIESPSSCLYYPLTPKVCLVICSMGEDWNAFTNRPKNVCGYQLDKGYAHMLNFYFAKSAELSLIISPEHENKFSDHMFPQLIGAYPQPPFPLHVVVGAKETTDSYEGICSIMEQEDGVSYGKWDASDIEPFYYDR